MLPMDSIDVPSRQDDRPDTTNGDATAQTARTAFLAAIGAALPYVAAAAGWKIADALANGKQDDAWWESASGFVYFGQMAALAAGAWLSSQHFRSTHTAAQFALIFLAITVYLPALLIFNGCCYVLTSAPFP